ncbi:hypothetical protein GGR52DRAFT_574127 [Hypoxylon sp. FL1284]|nr:hypothetical protein GGR52DRAFT_574127 [Hypoxylon sp. FL1284]
MIQTTSTPKKNPFDGARKTTYDKPTSAFLNRLSARAAASKKQCARRTTPSKQDVDCLAEAEIQVTPRFMRHTTSSRMKSRAPTQSDDSLDDSFSRCSDQWANYDDPWEQHSDPWDAPNDDANESEDIGWSKANAQAVSTFRGYNPIEIQVLVGPGVNDVFPGLPLRISYKAGFDLLAAAHRIAQEAFRNAAQKYWPPIWDCMDEGPHIVKLGYSEIRDYIRFYYDIPNDLGRCGSDGWTVYSSLMELPGIRNAVCHPCSRQLRRADDLECLLRNLHEFTVLVHDSENAARVRSLRDELLRLATESFDLTKSLALLAALPFANEADPFRDWKRHHTDMMIDMFRALLARRDAKNDAR